MEGKMNKESTSITTNSDINNSEKYPLGFTYTQFISGEYHRR